MIINSEDERRAHPQACFIPMPILRSQFNGCLSEAHLRLMRMPLEEITARIKDLNTYGPDEATRFWLCIALSHPDASGEALMQLARELNLSTEELFINAALIGHLAIITSLCATLKLDDVQDIIKHHYYKAFRFAALGGSLAVTRHLLEISSSGTYKLITAQNYQSFRFAAQGGYLPLIEEFIRLYPTETFAMVKSYDYEAFRLAAWGGHVEVLEKLKILVPPAQQLEMLQAKNYAAFRLAAEGGHLPAIDKLISLAPAELLNMVRADDYAAFRAAARCGHLHVMEKLIALAPDELLNMISADDFSAFRFAAEGGYLHVMEWLIASASGKIEDMIQARDYDAFWRAAKGGHLTVLERLLAWAPERMIDMVRAHSYKAFCEAARGGHLPILEKLIKLAPQKKRSMLSARYYEAFRLAAAAGHLDVIDWLIAEAPGDMLLEMIKAEHYEAFRLAAENGHLAVLNRLAVLAPAEIINMVKAGDYKAFGNAAENGHLMVVNRLIELASDGVFNMIQAGNYAALQWAAQHSRPFVVNRLLSFAEVMAFAEMHEHEYGSFVLPFITNTLAALRDKRVAFEAAHPRAVFDVAEDEAKNCFFIIRHLIRRNDPALMDDIRFLLEIPAIRALAHEGSSESIPNELARLAISIGNRTAAETLLTIPTVRELAEAHDYYSDETHGELNLKDLAKDAESSLHALSFREQKRLAAAIEKYKPLIDAAGVENLVDDLYETLIDRYERNPAKIIIDGKEVLLPLHWKSFSKLPLTPEQQEMALRAYYQHKDHTALRFLSRPNLWMSLEANYVYVNPDNIYERWSSVEEYLPLIAMLWVAVQDRTIPPTDGHTLEGRIDHFIDELAQTGRAHNWDNSRIKVDASGAPLVDENGHVIEEEYDDLMGDKPSCFSGMKRRFLQSVIGHPLLKILTEQDIKQELRDFLRSHFTSLIHDTNREMLWTAWHNYCASADLSDADPLRALDITSSQQALFIQMLTEKYGDQFSGEIKFTQMVKMAFVLVERKSNPSDCMHALKFAGLINLSQLLAPPVRMALTVVTAKDNVRGAGAGAGFFSPLSKLESAQRHGHYYLPSP